MKYWTTQIEARDPSTGIIKIYGGVKVPGITKEDAELYCQKNELGYCKVMNELIAEIPCDDQFIPDLKRMIDYDNIQKN